MSNRLFAIALSVVFVPWALYAQCGVPTAYTVAPAATGTQNWTDTSGSVWIPAGGYPGCTAGDVANASATLPLTLVVNAAIPNALAGLTLAGAGAMIDIQSGNLTLAGPGTITSGTTVKTSGGQFVIANGGAATFQSGSTLWMTAGTTHVQTGGQLTLDGTTTVTGGTLALEGTLTTSTTLPLGAGVSTTLQGGTINGTGSVNNSGYVEQNGGTSTITTPFNNVAGASGVQVNSGTLSLSGGGQGDAPFVLFGTLEFPAGTYTTGTAGVVSGSGTLRISGGTLSIGGVTDPANFRMTAGTLTGAGFLSIGGTFDWQGGTIAGSGGSEIAGTGTGTFSGTTGPMILDSRTLNVYGTVDFSATTNSLELANGATLGVYGTFRFTADGSITCSCGTPPLLLISPNGILEKTGGAGTSVIAPPTTNNARIAVLSGTLELAGDGQHDGSFHAAATTTLRFSAFDSLFDVNSSIAGEGTIEFLDGGNTVGGTYSVAGRTVIDGAGVAFAAAGETSGFDLINGGFLVLDAPFKMTGTGTWSDGTIASLGSGTFTVDGGGTLTIDAATCVPTLIDIELINDGTILYTPTAVSTNHLELSGATITNNGTFDMQADAPITVSSLVAEAAQGGCSGSSARRPRLPLRSDGLFFDPSYINNNGTWKKTGAGTSDIEPVFTNSGTVLAQAGVLHFTSFTQTAGTTRLGPGNVEVDSAMALNGGTLDGAGTVTGDLNNDATVAPGNGTTGVINVSGNYTQGTNGTLAIGIAGPAPGQFDQLAVGGAATLAGAFSATLLNPYAPTAGTTWNVLTYASHSGTFASQSLPPLVTSSYTPTAYVLQAIALSADLSAGMTGPASVNAGAPLSYVVTITNNGPNASSGTITVTDTLPAGVTGAAATGSGWTCNPPSGGVVTCTTTATVASTASLPAITFTMTAPVAGGSVQNSATVSSSFDSNAANDTASVSTNVVAQADLQIVKSGPANVAAGQNIVYTIVVTNNGPSSAANVVVSDPTPANTTFVSNSGACATAFPCSLGALASGQSATITSTFSTSPTFGGNVTNVAAVSSSTADPNNANDSSTRVTAVAVEADVSIVKNGPNGIIAGQNIVYTIVVTNNGPSTASSVVVSDPTPANTTFVSNSGACSTPFPCSLGTLVSGQSVTITSTFSTSASFNGDVTNVATVSSTGDPNGANNSSTKVTNVGAQADLSITKTGPASTNPGQNVVYTITFLNNGPSPATGAVVSDPTPPGVAWISNSGACTTPFPCNLGTLAAGQGGTITATFFVPANYTGGSIANTASISSSVNDPNATNSTSTATTTVATAADVSITKTGPATVTPGQNIVYTVIVTNGGPSSAGGVVVSDPTPAGLTFVSNTGACTTAYPCSLGTLTNGQTATITSTFTVPSSYSGASVVNTATVTSGANDGNTANNSSTTTATATPQADLAITKTGPATITPGQNIVYTVTVTNNGPSSAGAVVVSDPTPAGLTFVSNSGACTTAYPCSLGVLASGQTATITSTFSVPSNYSAASVVNTATVTSGTNDANAVNNSATSTATTNAQADLAITKTGPATFTQGTNIVYTIAVTNNGPIAATNTFVTDPTPAGLTFVSNSGACTTAFPCALGTVSAGQTVTITSTFAASPSFAGTSVTNTASVSASTLDVNLANNSSSTTATLSPSAADVAITKTGPGGARQFELIDFTITVRNNGPATATNVVVSDPPPQGMTWISNSGACTTNFPCSLGTLTPGQSATITATYRFASVSGSVTNTATVTSSPADSNTANNTATANVAAGPVFTCPTGGPVLLSPINGATLSATGSVTFSWSSVANAIGYFLTVTPAGGGTPVVINVGTTSATVPLQPGPYSWTVASAGVESCRPLASPPSSFLICATLNAAPVASVVGESTTGQTYAVEWSLVDGATSYELQESLSPAFTNPVVHMVAANGKSFTKTASVATAYWYRVRALASCNPAPGPFSTAIAVVVVPVPLSSNHDPNVNVPNGSSTPVTWQIFVPGLPEGTTSFIATVDRPWLTVVPASGIILPAGMNFTVSADPSTLTNGTWTGTLIVVYGTSSVNSIASDATTKFTAPISISLVTPVTPATLSGATNTATLVPSVGHLAGIDSLWRSDIRLANLAPAAQKFQLVFNPGTGGASTPTKMTTITVDAGVTTALDDIVRNWYGIGSLGNSSNGVLTVQPLDAAGKPLATLTNVSAVSSRTFNASATGTFGQFVPAVPFSKFIGRGGSGAAASALSLQQIAQTAAYRTNLGLVEGAGRTADVVVTAFDGSGGKLFDLPLTLQAGEQRQLNGFLAANGVTSLANGRIEVRVTGGDGKVTAYASVVDNRSNDPILISGTAVDSIGTNRFVVPGIADFSGGGSNWRSDMRVFNSGSTPQAATLTFYPSGGAAPLTAQVSIAPGEVKQLDDVLHSILGVTNLGGALHVTTPSNAPLVVTARTYDQTSAGTLGQFIPAVTTSEAVSLGDRALQILQAEESSRYRTNVGVVEVTGKPATVQISVHLPDSKVTPTIQIPLAAFESRQIPVLGSLGLGAVYNARISVRVIGGDGRVTGYGSVIDMATKDPTFIPAQ